MAKAKKQPVVEEVQETTQQVEEQLAQEEVVIESGIVEVVGLNGHMKGKPYKVSAQHAKKLVEKGQAKYA